MSDELLMELSDCASPERLIGVLLKHHPQWPRRVPVEDLAQTVGITEIKDLDVDEFEGALMTNATKSQGVIFVRTGVRDERRRFTLAHELGHFLIPSHKGDRRCTSADLRESRQETQHQRQEAEANRFAAGLLMPRPWFVSDMRALGNADVTHVQRLAEACGTSLEATANRYIDLTDDACAFVFSKDGVIRYARRTDNFPKLAVKAGDPLPTGCSSLRTPATPLRAATSWAELDGAVWLETTRGQRAPVILEQSMRQQGGFQVTLLFVEVVYDEDDEVLEESWTPRFSRR